MQHVTEYKGGSVQNVNVPISPFKSAGSWWYMYLVRGLKEDTPYFNVTRMVSRKKNHDGIVS